MNTDQQHDATGQGRALPAPATPVPVPASVGESKKAAKLAERAARAAQVRAYELHPDVIAHGVEKVRRQVDAMIWAAVVLGLGFTMVNVQAFAAAGAREFSAGWWTAWLLDPMVSLVVLAIVRAEQVTAPRQVKLGWRVQWVKFATLAATYTMNTWAAWTGGVASQVSLHSVPPLLVFAGAAVGPIVRDRMTEAVHVALAAAARRNQHQQRAGGVVVEATVTARRVSPARHDTSPAAEHDASRPAGPDTSALPAPAAPRAELPAAPPARARRSSGKARRGRKKPRRLLADFVAAARPHLAPGVDPTPAWCQKVTGCSNGTSVKVATALRAEIADTGTGPDAPTSLPTTQPTDQEGTNQEQEVAA